MSFSPREGTIFLSGGIPLLVLEVGSFGPSMAWRQDGSATAIILYKGKIMYVVFQPDLGGGEIT